MNPLDDTYGSFNTGNMIPLIPYAKSISANPKTLRRQTAKYGALIQRGGIDFIDLPTLDTGQRAELEEKNKAKVMKKDLGKKSSGSIETTNSLGILRALYKKLQQSIPRKERELSELSARVDSETDPIEKKTVSHKRNIKRRSLDRSRETFARAERRLIELANEEPDSTVD